MPKKIPGYHGIHVHIREDYWIGLQLWGASGLTRIPAKLIMNTLLEQFYLEHVAKERGTDLDTISESIAEAVQNSIQLIEKKQWGSLR